MQLLEVTFIPALIWISAGNVFLNASRFATLKIDFWKEPSHLFQAVDIGVSEEDFITLSSLLEADGIEYKVQIDDVQKLIEGELQNVGARGFSQSWHNQYHDLDEVWL